MWQPQLEYRHERDTHAAPSGQPSGEDRERKWWHVPDDALEAFVHSLASESEGIPQVGALGQRSSSAGTLQHRSVRFQCGDVQFEYAIDREMRLNVERTSFNHGLAMSNKRGAKRWKVPDEKLLDFIQQTAQATAADGVVMEAAVGGHF